MQINNTQMRHYTSVQSVQACHMTRGDYNTYRGWTMPEGENGSDPGYLVKPASGPTSDDQDYVTWMPANIFERGHQQSESMGFGAAIEDLKMGDRQRLKEAYDQVFRLHHDLGLARMQLRISMGITFLVGGLSVLLSLY